MQQVGSIYTAPDPTEVARRPLEADSTALIVVDIQEKLLPPIFEKERLVRNAQLLLRLAGILGLPVLATTQYAKGLGPTVPEIASLLPPSPASGATGSVRRFASCPGPETRWLSAGWRRTSAYCKRCWGL